MLRFVATTTTVSPRPQEVRTTTTTCKIGFFEPTKDDSSHPQPLSFVLKHPAADALALISKVWLCWALDSPKVFYRAAIPPMTVAAGMIQYVAEKSHFMIIYRSLFALY